MRRCALVIIASLVAGPAQARGTRLLVLVRAADSETAVVGKRLALELGRAAEAEPGYDRVDLDELTSGPEGERAHRELAAARRKAKRGYDALLSLDLRGAAQLLRDAVATFKDNAAYLNDTTDLGHALLHLSACLWHTGKHAAAKKLIAEAITLVPELEVDPQIYNPPMREMFDKVRARVAATRGSLAIHSSPEGAVAVVDGRVVGLTPVTEHDLHAGRHVVRVIDDGLISWGAMVEVKKGTETRVAAQLRASSRHRDLPGQIGDTFRAAANAGNAAKHVADLGKPLGVDQILLARVRTDGDVTLVDAALYGIQRGVRLARLSRKIPSRGSLEREARELLAGLAPPPLSILVAALRTPAGRDELANATKRTVTKIVGRRNGSVKFLSTPLNPPCFDDPSCVRAAAADLAADGVLELDMRGGTRVRIQASCLDGHSGERLWSHQFSVVADNLHHAPAFEAALLRAVDAVWESRASADPSILERTEQPSLEGESDIMRAPAPDDAEPLRWDRLFGWATIAVGAAAAIGGTALALERNGVLSDPLTPGADKSSAQQTGRFALGGAAIGLGIAGLGTWLTWDSYQN